MRHVRTHIFIPREALRPPSQASDGVEGRIHFRSSQARPGQAWSASPSREEPKPRWTKQKGNGTRARARQGLASCDLTHHERKRSGASRLFTLALRDQNTGAPFDLGESKKEERSIKRTNMRPSEAGIRSTPNLKSPRFFSSTPSTSTQLAVTNTRYPTPPSFYL